MSVLAALFVLLSVADDSPTIDPASVASLSLEPAQIVLQDPRDSQQLLVTGQVGERLVDLTELVEWQIVDPRIAHTTPLAEIRPLADGSTEVVATFGSHSVRATVQVANMFAGRPINFANEIVPVFTKLTCNSGGCHGKSGGQNGFALSLLGFEPDKDYATLVKDGRGRRVFPAAPEQSLLLRKASGSLPHGGGRWMRPGDDHYRLVESWIRQGMPYGNADDPVVTAIEVIPGQRTMERHGVQRLRVVASYSDGRRLDVTRQALFESNDREVAEVDVLGRVTTGEFAGESAIMARYMGQVAVFRATVPLDRPVDQPIPFTARSYIDELTLAKWRQLGLAPSPPANDHQFVRRLYVDLCGRLPTVAEVDQFVASTDPDKRDKLVDQLLDSGDYAAMMALKWGAVLQNKRSGSDDNAPATHAMSLWLKEAFLNDLPYDQFVRAILTATGTPESHPPVIWYRHVRTPEDNVDNASQLFLGMRVQCARCHHHPFEKWGQDDYYAMASFFSRIGRKGTEKFETGTVNESVFVQKSGTANHPKTGQPVAPRGLDGQPLDVAPGEDPRAKLVDWMTAADNPFFAKALANRMWGHFFSRGIVEPIDDMRVTNPPSNPELLDALARDFVDNGYSIKQLIRAICKSATYQLSSEPSEFNQHDKQNFARYYPKRLQAEVLLDALDQVTAVPTSLGFPAEMRVVELPDEAIGSYFLDIFGRPMRTSSCECERSGDSNLSQALHLLNSQDVQTKLVHDTGRAATLAADPRPDEEKVRELFVWFFARPPAAEELQAALEHLQSQADKKTAYQNILWALLNTKEFQFNL